MASPFFFGGMMIQHPEEVLIRSAELHGQLSEPDHEVGDLQDIVRLMAGRLTLEELNEVLKEHQLNQGEFVDAALLEVA